MKAKVVYMLVGFGVLGGMAYLINRLSTKFHPYGNWIITGVVLIVAAVVIAWVWNDYDDSQGKG